MVLRRAPQTCRRRSARRPRRRSVRTFPHRYTTGGPPIPASGSPRDRQAVPAVDLRLVPQRCGVVRYREAELREARYQCGQSYSYLDAGELLPQALVRAVAEAQMAGGVAVDIQGIGVIEPAGVPVRRL